MHVVIDGIDGSGKDVQAKLLMSSWSNHGYKPILVSEPDTDMPGGAELRNLLKSGRHPVAQAGLFLANRMALQVAKVKPALEVGRHVVNVRSFLSTLAYQQEQSLPLNWLFQIHDQLLCKPTHIIVLDLDPDEALGRTHKRHGHAEIYERLDIQKRIRQRYLDLAADSRLTRFMEHDGRVVVIDASGPPEEVHARIVEWMGENS